jgi:hypothetical protein
VTAKMLDQILRLAPKNGVSIRDVTNSSPSISPPVTASFVNRM